MSTGLGRGQLFLWCFSLHHVIILSFPFLRVLPKSPSFTLPLLYSHNTMSPFQFGDPDTFNKFNRQLRNYNSPFFSSRLASCSSSTFFSIAPLLLFFKIAPQSQCHNEEDTGYRYAMKDYFSPFLSLATPAYDRNQ